MIQNTHQKVAICGLSIDNLTMQETIDLVNNAIENQGDITLTDINAGKIIQIREDAQLKSYVDQSDIIQADGQAVIWASQLLKKPLKERVAGVDLVENLIKQAYNNGHKVFFFGAQEEVVKEVVNKFVSKYSENILAGYRNGYFKHNEAPSIAKQIADSGANLLFVAITSPIQEQFLIENKEVLKSVNFKMGVGGSFDVFAGKTKRAPIWMQNAGLEWFYRFLQEPKRMWKRYLVGNSKFIYLVMKERFSK
ncbi:WecB/TagA/CpsF family glycosyltransferase [Aequorivita sinensis]|uniref:WecB/TagA/CpsF family glycosyltransferase n=1 Tax=Aequorivita TaxID=153265 RepID=UPI001FEB8442|nr:WecB/TagA/CpsF family glycosyltransferase [Aequorivita sinensis]